MLIKIKGYQTFSRSGEKTQHVAAVFVKSYAEKNMWFRPYALNFFLKVINTNYFTDRENSEKNLTQWLLSRVIHNVNKRTLKTWFCSLWTDNDCSIRDIWHLTPEDFKCQRNSANYTIAHSKTRSYVLILLDREGETERSRAAAVLHHMKVWMERFECPHHDLRAWDFFFFEHVCVRYMQEV